jgi:hypothetical protein
LSIQAQALIRILFVLGAPGDRHELGAHKKELEARLDAPAPPPVRLPQRT